MSRLLVLTWALLLMCPVSAASQAIAPPAPGADASSPYTPCKPGKSQLCAKTGTVAEGAAALLRATAARGLGVPRPAAIGTSRRVKAAERAMVTQLSTLPADATAAQASPATVRDRVVASAAVANSRGSHKRRFTFDGESAVCPVDDNAASSHGEVPFVIEATLTTVTVERVGRLTITTTISTSLRMRRNASVNRRAEFDFVLAVGADPLEIRRRQVTKRGSQVIDRDSATAELDVETLSPDAGVKFRSESFDAFVERMEAQERGEPDPRAGAPILGQAWKALARSFAQMVAARTQALIKRAERVWRTPNRCIKLELEGPERLATSSTTKLTGRVTSLAGPATPRQILGDGLGSATWSDARVVIGESASSLVATLPLPTDAPWIEFKSPAQQWTESTKPGLDMTLPTKLGIGKAEKRFLPSPVPKALRGTWTRTQHQVSPDSDITTTWSGQATFRRNLTTYPDTVPIWVFAFESGSATWTATGAAASCTHAGNGEVTIVKDAVFDNVRLTLEDVTRNGLGRPPSPEPTPFYYEILAGIQPPSSAPTYTITCPSSTSIGAVSPEIAKIGFRDWWVQNAPPTVQKTADPRRLAGTQTTQTVIGSTTVTITHTWSFDAIE